MAKFRDDRPSDLGGGGEQRNIKTSTAKQNGRLEMDLQVDRTSTHSAHLQPVRMSEIDEHWNTIATLTTRSEWLANCQLRSCYHPIQCRAYFNRKSRLNVQYLKATRSSAIAGRQCDAKACQGLLKWTWKWQPRLKWPSKYFKVIKSGTHRKLVYDFLLVVYSNFCRITHRFWEIWCETVNDLEICPRSFTVVSPESCLVAMYVKYSEDSERMKRKSPFSTTPFSIDVPSPANPREYLHKPYTARNYVPWATFLSLTVYG